MPNAVSLLVTEEDVTADATVVKLKEKAVRNGVVPADVGKSSSGQMGDDALIEIRDVHGEINVACVRHEIMVANET
jgi:hypothetical protein